MGREATCIYFYMDNHFVSDPLFVVCYYMCDKALICGLVPDSWL